MIDDVFEKRDVCFDAAYTEFAKGAVGAVAGLFEFAGPRADLYKQRIVVRRDGRAAVGRAAIEPHPEACR